MPDTELHVKATGAEEVKRTFKGIADYAKQLDRYTSKGSLSSKEMEGARRAQENFNKSQVQAIRNLQTLKREEQEYYNILNRNAKLLNEQRRADTKAGLTSPSGRWHELNRMARYYEHGLERTIKQGSRIESAMQVGGQASRRLGAYEEETPVSGGVAGRLGAALFGGIGLATAGALVYKSIQAANTVNDTLLDLGATLRTSGNQVIGMPGNMRTRLTGNDFINMGVQDISRGGALQTRAAMLGYGAPEISAMGLAMSHTGGWNGNQDTLSRMMVSQRMYGVDPQAMIGMAAVGARGRVSVGNGTMGAVITEGVAAGFRKEGFQRTLQEFVEATTDLTATFQKTAGSVDLAIAGRILGIFSGAASRGSAFMQGAPGAEMIGQLNASLTNPGGGIAGQLSMLRVAGFGQGKMNWWEAQKVLSGGFGKNPKLLARYLGQAAAYGGEAGEQFLSMVGGIQPLAAQDLMKANTPEFRKAIAGAKEQAGIDTILSTTGLKGDIQNTVDMLKDKGLAGALASLSARATLATSYQDMGQTIIELLTTIASELGGTTNHGSPSHVTDLDKIAASNPWYKLIYFGQTAKAHPP